MSFLPLWVLPFGTCLFYFRELSAKSLIRWIYCRIESRRSKRADFRNASPAPPCRECQSWRGRIRRGAQGYRRPSRAQGHARPLRQSDRSIVSRWPCTEPCGRGSGMSPLRAKLFRTVSRSLPLLLCYYLIPRVSSGTVSKLIWTGFFFTDLFVLLSYLTHRPFKSSAP